MKTLENQNQRLTFALITRLTYAPALVLALSSTVASTTAFAVGNGKRQLPQPSVQSTQPATALPASDPAPAPAPASAPEPSTARASVPAVRGPLKFLEILNGQVGQVPSRLIYRGGASFEGESTRFVACAQFDATDEIKAEQTFKLIETPDNFLNHVGNPINDAESINWYQYNDRLFCRAGRLVYLNLQGLMPLVSTRVRTFYNAQVKSKTAQGQVADLSFEGFLKGGQAMRLKLKMRINNWPMDSVLIQMQPVHLAHKDTLTWEGDFYAKDCETDSGATVELTQPKLKSVADILESQKDVMNPTFARCNFVAREMVSRDTPDWSREHGEIFPRLKNVTVTVHPHYASIYYTALNGLKFKAERLRAARSTNADSTQLMATAQALMNILNGVIPRLVENERDTHLPSVIAYLRQNREEIRRLLDDLNTQLQDPKAPFDAIFNVSLSLNRAYQFLDQALGLVSDQQVNFERALELANMKAQP